MYVYISILIGIPVMSFLSYHIFMSVYLFCYPVLVCVAFDLLAEVIYNWRPDRRNGKPGGSHERSKCDNATSVWMLISSDSSCETRVSLNNPQNLWTHSDELAMWRNQLTSKHLSCCVMLLASNNAADHRISWQIVDLWQLMASAQSHGGLWLCGDNF